jgi:hypothetical protein
MATEQDKTGKLLLQFGKKGVGVASKEKSRGAKEGCYREEKGSR